jgi:argininosuccinate lyase
MGTVIQAHNITPGMSDPKEVKANSAMVHGAIALLKNWDKILNSLVVSPERALEELNSDWTASQELADVLMRKYKLPFRVGHHFASEVVDYAKKEDLKPLDFPYAEAKRIYADVVSGSRYPAELPMSEQEFRSTLDPVAIVKHRMSAGGPQPAEMERMLSASRQKLSRQGEWIKERRAKITASLDKLDLDFDRLATGGR